VIAAPEGYVPIRKIATGLDVAPLRAALRANPSLWNARTARTSPPDSPHHGLDDIWVRFAAPGAVVHEDGSHTSSWLADADVLPVRPMAFQLMAALNGEQLGGILITRIPPGVRCRPHVDPGWHARHYDKFAVQIDADPKTQAFCFEGHHLASEPGDLYWFDNHYTHWVDNEGPHARVTAIFCIRTEHTKGE
jgi:hypothetical protein